VVGKLKNEGEFNNLIIRNDSGRITRMKDVGYAELGVENEETILRSSGVPMIGLGVVPQPGANYINIADEFYKRYEQIEKEIPKGYKLDVAMDNTKFIRKSIEEVQETLLIAIILVVIIIYLFFRDWVVAFRPLIDIPVSLVGTFFIMYLMGFSINVLTLLAIVLATGHEPHRGGHQRFQRDHVRGDLHFTYIGGSIPAYTIHSWVCRKVVYRIRSSDCVSSIDLRVCFAHADTYAQRLSRSQKDQEKLVL
jgi:uncharacterized membrane protein YhaH (DUF805 family)